MSHQSHRSPLASRVNVAFVGTCKVDSADINVRFVTSISRVRVMTFSGIVATPECLSLCNA